MKDFADLPRTPLLQKFIDNLGHLATPLHNTFRTYCPTSKQLDADSYRIQEQESIPAFWKSDSLSVDSKKPVEEEKAEVAFYLSRKNKKLKGKVLERFDLFGKTFKLPKGKAEAADVFLSVYSDPVCMAMIKGAEIEARKRSFTISRWS